MILKSLFKGSKPIQLTCLHLSDSQTPRIILPLMGHVLCKIQKINRKIKPFAIISLMENHTVFKNIHTT